MPSQKDRGILRSLAARVREIAELPAMKERRQLWFDLNALRPQRPMILCSPEGAWGELLPDGTLQCEDADPRGIEWSLRSKIYWWETIRDDMPIDPWLEMSWHVDIGDFGVPVPYRHGENRGSYVWDPPIKDLDRDLPKLRFRPLSVDRQKTAATMMRAWDLVGDLLPPRLRGGYWWTLGLTWKAIELVGLEPLMLAMCDNPAGVHRLMGFLRDEAIHFITWFEKAGLLGLNNGGNLIASGGIGYTRELPRHDWRPGSPVRLKDMWGFAESQETVGVGPEMFAEFVLPYQLPLLQRFGLNSYGCCEPVHMRIDSILKVPRLRRVSVSPWADERIMAERLGKDIIFSRKPNPAMICASFDEDQIRADVRQTLDIAGGCALEIIMKDTHTVQNRPERISRWVEIAREEVERYVGG